MTIDSTQRIRAAISMLDSTRSLEGKLLPHEVRAVAAHIVHHIEEDEAEEDKAVMDFKFPHGFKKKFEDQIKELRELRKSRRRRHKHAAAYTALGIDAYSEPTRLGQLSFVRKFSSITKIARAAFDRCDYKRASGKWAGGTSVIVDWNLNIQGPRFFTLKNIAWSDNKKWSGTAVEYRVAVTSAWAKVHLMGLSVVDGCFVFTVEPTGEPDIIKIQIGRQSGRGYEAKIEQEYWRIEPVNDGAWCKTIQVPKVKALWRVQP